MKLEHDHRRSNHDNIFVAGSNERKIEDIKHKFTMRYEMKNLGKLNHYLEMKVTKTAKYVKLNQHRYCLNILAKYDYLLQSLKTSITQLRLNET